ncbi:hypothetical protein MTO96_015896 [Rhipicephalus appendiculatus]
MGIDSPSAIRTLHLFSGSGSTFLEHSPADKNSTSMPFDGHSAQTEDDVCCVSGDLAMPGRPPRQPGPRGEAMEQRRCTFFRPLLRTPDETAPESRVRPAPRERRLAGPFDRPRSLARDSGRVKWHWMPAHKKVHVTFLYLMG